MSLTILKWLWLPYKGKIGNWSFKQMLFLLPVIEKKILFLQRTPFGKTLLEFLLLHG